MCVRGGSDSGKYMEVQLDVLESGQAYDPKWRHLTGKRGILKNDGCIDVNQPVSVSGASNKAESLLEFHVLEFDGW
eukprot:scaffold3410_cov158-Amphora_coffeaeformis.AAC.2